MGIEIVRAPLWACVLVAFGLAQGCGDDGGDGAAGLPSPVPCDACGSGETCVRGACVAACGGDPSLFDAALADGVSIVAGYCRASLAYGASGPARVLDLRASEGAGVVNATVARVELDAGNGTPDAERAGDASLVPAEAGPLFWGAYVAESPDGARHAFGYTQAFGDPGRLFVTGAAATREVDAPGNFAAAWLDDATLLVNGLGLGDDAAGAQGLDALVLDDADGDATRRVLGEAFDFSGSIVVRDDLVLYGAVAFDAESGATDPRMLAMSRAAVLALVADPGAPPIAGTADARVVSIEGGPSAFVDVGGGRFAVTRFNAEFERIFELVSSSGSTPDTFTLGAAVPLAGPADEDPDAFDEVFTGVVATSSPDRLLLVHGDGLLLVDVGRM